MTGLRSSAPTLMALVLAAVIAGSEVGAARQADFGGYRPHYQGFGADTRGGRGGAVLRVTHLGDTLDTTSPRWIGSLRRALTAGGARIVVFEVSGTISLVSEIRITNPYLTVAGQTAPSPGITIRNRSIFIDTNDVVIQHVRLRMGDLHCVNACAGGGVPALYVRNNAFKVVLDHLSVSWGTEGGIAVNAWSGPQPYDIAILDCIVAENLAKPRNPFGIGTLFMPSDRGTATFARNLHAHNGNRNPWVAPGWRFSGFNNVAYNAGSLAGDAGTLAFFQLMGGYGSRAPFDAVWVSNVAIPGPNTHRDGRPVKVDIRFGEVGVANRLYLEDNVGPYQSSADQWGGVTFMNAAAEWRIKADSPPDWHLNIRHTVLPASQVLPHVLANAGARPTDRDAVDARIVRDVVNRTGRRISTPAEVGGYPPLAEVRRPLPVPVDADAVVDRAGRTRIEAWLEGHARALEPRWRSAAPEDRR